MIHLQGIHLKRGSKDVFTGLTLAIHGGQRMGVVGRNGIGKSSLFGLIRERLLPDEGEVKVPGAWVIAHMEQETAASTRSALDHVIDGDRELRAIEARLAKAEANEDHDRLASLHAELDAVDGYTAPARAGQILHGLGFEPDDLARPVADFSGGWRIRLNLAQTLMCRSDLLLLDEPTNHLDLDATLWLEHWLVRREGTALVISHDRDFLDRVVTDIAHLEAGRARAYRGNYTSFERQRAERLALEQSLHARQQRRAAEIRAFVDRFRAKATKARQAQSRLKQLERMELAAPAHVDSPYRFSFPGPERASNPLLDVEDGVLGYGDTPVLENLRLKIAPGARIGLLGKNGAGKSTLMRGIAGEIALMSGKRARGKHASVGYFTQHTMETLTPERSPLDHLQRLAGGASEQDGRNYLGGWGFPGDSALDPAGTLSGGEKARLALALIAWTRPALLLLDEPTNHLDLEMRHALTVALQAFEGAIVIVSHDRRLIENTVDELLLVAQRTVKPYAGTLDEYRDWLLGRNERRPAQADTDAPALSRNEKRRESARRREEARPLRKAIGDLEKRMDELREKLEPVNAALADTATYESLDGEELGDLIARHKRYSQRLEGLEEEWLALSERLEAATT